MCFQCLDKLNSGLLHSHVVCPRSNLPSPSPSFGSRVKKNWAKKTTTYIGSSFFASVRKDPYELFKTCGRVVMPNRPDPMPPTSMFKKKRPVYLARNLKKEPNPLEGMSRPTGTQFGNQQYLGTSCPYQRMLEFRIIVPYDRYNPIMHNLLPLNEAAMCSLGEQELVSPVVPGMKLGWMLTLRTPELNSGAATEIKRTLSLMNFVGELILPTYCDGLIVTPSLWRLKVVQPYLEPKPFGSPAIAPSVPGTQD